MSFNCLLIVPSNREFSRLVQARPRGSKPRGNRCTGTPAWVKAPSAAVVQALARPGPGDGLCMCMRGAGGRTSAHRTPGGRTSAPRAPKYPENNTLLVTMIGYPNCQVGAFGNLVYTWARTGASTVPGLEHTHIGCIQCCKSC